MEKRIFAVGIGPGDASEMTPEADRALRQSQVIAGYPVYIELVRDRYPDKEFLTTPMGEEIKRCLLCFEEAEKGRIVSLVSGGDAGVYGMAGPLLELSEKYPDVEISVIPGVTAALAGAALLGAPLTHDFCVISLSDILTPQELIERRLRAAAEGDFCIVLYNPGSRKRPEALKRAAEVLLESMEPERPAGIAENIGRAGSSSGICTLRELLDVPVNMFMTVFVGNSQTAIIGGRLVTPRGYGLKVT
ncbi:MAG: precorrin-3B C(17)-methyltransferase [Lachnospiraceae bacterium]|nr:precorrin-3B C(17)-methyltransferase [Lachnospiraceae bacterium]